MPPSLYQRLTPEQIADIKLRYENDLGTLSEIAEAHGLVEWQVNNLRAKFGWPSRRARQRAAIERSVAHERAIDAADRRQRDAAKAASLQEQDDASPRHAEDSVSQPPAVTSDDAKNAPVFDAETLVQRVRRTVEQELAALRANPDSEARMRALVQMTRALRDLHTMQREERGAKPGMQNDESVIDIAELRRELSRKLADLRREGDAAAADRASEP